MQIAADRAITRSQAPASTFTSAQAARRRKARATARQRHIVRPIRQRLRCDR